MTFEQMPYERVDLQSLVQTYEELTRQMRQAASAQEAAQVLRRHQQVYEPAATMMGLSAIRHTIDTEDPFYTGEEEFYAENGPALGEKVSGLYRATLESPFRAELEQQFPPVFFQNAEIDVRTISPDVLGELEQENKLVMEYQKLQGGAQIEFQGKVLNLSELSVYKENPDRAVRQAA